MTNIVGLSPAGRFVQKGAAETVFTRPWELVIGKGRVVEVLTTVAIVIATLGIALIGLIGTAFTVMVSKDQSPKSRLSQINYVNVQLNKLPDFAKVQILEKMQEKGIDNTITSNTSRQWCIDVIEYSLSQSNLFEKDPDVFKVHLESYIDGYNKNLKDIEYSPENGWENLSVEKKEELLTELVVYFFPFSGKLLEVFLPEIEKFVKTINLEPILLRLKTIEISDGKEKDKFMLSKIHQLCVDHFMNQGVLSDIWKSAEAVVIAGDKTAEYYKKLYATQGLQSFLNTQKESMVSFQYAAICKVVGTAEVMSEVSA